MLCFAGSSLINLVFTVSLDCIIFLVLDSVFCFVQWRAVQTCSLGAIGYAL